LSLIHCYVNYTVWGYPLLGCGKNTLQLVIVQPINILGSIGVEAYCVVSYSIHCTVSSGS